VHVGCSDWFYWHWGPTFTLPGCRPRIGFGITPAVRNGRTRRSVLFLANGRHRAGKVTTVGRCKFVYTVKASELITHVWLEELFIDDYQLPKQWMFTPGLFSLGLWTRGPNSHGGRQVERFATPCYSGPWPQRLPKRWCATREGTAVRATAAHTSDLSSSKDAIRHSSKGQESRFRYSHFSASARRLPRDPHNLGCLETHPLTREF
jgi:hypothetical protein